MTNRLTHVWYVSYFSNICEARFMKYVAGGTAGTRTYSGCRDTSPPTGDAVMWVPGNLIFALESKVWGGGKAFVIPRTWSGDKYGVTIGRGWRITREQFLDVVQQENGLEHPIDFPLESIADGELWDMGYGGDYDSLWRIGGPDHEPFFTFTSPLVRLPGGPTRNEPSEAYLDMFRAGMAEIGSGIEARGIANYLEEGIRR